MNANRIMGGGPAFQKGIADKPKMKTTQILKRLWKYLYHFKWFLFLALGDFLIDAAGTDQLFVGSISDAAAMI